MTSLINNIVSFFGTVWGTISGFARVFVNLISILGKCVSFMGAVIGHLPVYFTVPMGILVIVAVLYKILGREGQD